MACKCYFMINKRLRQTNRTNFDLNKQFLNLINIYYCVSESKQNLKNKIDFYRGEIEE